MDTLVLLAVTLAVAFALSLLVRRLGAPAGRRRAVLPSHYSVERYVTRHPISDVSCEECGVPVEPGNRRCWNCGVRVRPEESTDAGDR